MGQSFQRWFLFVFAINIFRNFAVCNEVDTSPVITTAASVPTVSSSNGTCEPHTINYITYNPFASICFEHSIPSPTSNVGNITSSTLEVPAEGDSATIATSTQHSGVNTSQDTAQISTVQVAPAPQPSGVHSDIEPDGGALEDAAFLSFEDWKKQVLEKAKGDPDALDLGRDAERRRRSEPNREHLDTLEDDGEIDIDFGAFLDDSSGDKPGTGSHSEDNTNQKAGIYDDQDENGEHGDGKRRYRSKDAGKTCKERTNFASMDLGAQLMKTNPEAKSASALLSENRDAYMLNDCQAKNKFFIVELSEAILVETVAIANFEFFSSTFRQFRISVSDRYPVKLDRWVDLGTFEARNSRDLQAFLVEDPRIWARYLRVEFLSHFGNEFYCPVSLLRVHGRTMIQDVLSMEQQSGSEDDSETDDPRSLPETEGEGLIPEAIAEVLIADQKDTNGQNLTGLVNNTENSGSEQLDDSSDSTHHFGFDTVENIFANQTTSTWNQSDAPDSTFAIFYSWRTCDVSEDPMMGHLSAVGPVKETGTPDSVIVSDTAETSQPACTHPSQTQAEEMGSKTVETLPSVSETSTPMSQNVSVPTSEIPIHYPTASSSGNLTINGNSSIPTKSTPIATAHPSQPTTQESFFKTISKRLQLLESNSTLSLKYIEEQSKILREAFSKVEKKQLGKTTSFLENLNGTVLNELRKYSVQYDQMWQSTVLELENQRSESQREIEAVSARLNMLAEELVFQRRMSIVQSVLLLLCLGLVVCSRALASGVVDVPLVQNSVKSRNVSDSNLDDKFSSLSMPNTKSPPGLSNTWLHADHNRQRSEWSVESMLSRQPDDPTSTPFSPASEQDDDSAHKKMYSSPVIYHETAGHTGRSKSTSHIEGPSSHSWQEDGAILPTAQAPSTNSENQAQTRSPTSLSITAEFSEQNDSLRDTPSSPYLKEQSRQTSMSDSSTHKFKSITPGSSQLMTPSPERQFHEFNVARKPLPALPSESG